MTKAGDGGMGGRRYGKDISVLVFLMAAACTGLGGVRPRITPLVGSVTRVAPERPEVLVRAFDDALRARQLPLVAVSQVEGYVETEWLDIDTRAARRPGATGLERIVKLRLFVDPVGGRSRVVGEAVRRYLWDPSLPERELERAVPVDHPGRALLDSIMTSVLGPEPTTPDSTARPPR